ncbi:hypothetical protein [uncultured Ruminococcus sp.]|uniref:hypothetical protein n=1 Tax=uncultured Ruminococcus sp. TaxID=165186 RepID=UPI002604DF62|nr:hypothetical protein [uncultured Ruminococcus sp.]
MIQQFFKNAGGVKGQSPLSPPAGGETPRRILLRRGEGGEKKRQLFRGGANKTAPPCKAFSTSKTLKTSRRDVFNEYFNEQFQLF